jgi:hypothetical protein
LVSKPSHLHQHLVQRLFAFVVATAQPGAALATHRIDFVDEDDAGGVLFGVLEHVAHTRCAHTDEHLHEVRTRNAEERHLRLAGNAFGQERLAGAGRADQQEATRDAPAEFLEFLRVLEEVYDLLDLFLGLVTARDVGKRDLVRAFVEHPGLALAEAEGAALTTRPASGA